MSDCGSRQLGEGRIPSSLIDTYVQYKKDTRAVITWLASHGTGKYERLTALSLQDLHSLAEIVQTKAVEMPGTIDFQFREAIAARTLLSKWYRRVHDHYRDDDQDTCNHEHFTTCLSMIYKNLCNCCAKPKDKCTRAHQRSKSDDKRRSPPNRFATLEPGHERQSKKVDATFQKLEMKAKENKIKCADTPTLRLLDDTLSEAFELRKEIQDMYDLLNITRRIWEKAAQGTTSIVVATFVTHLAFAEFEDIGDRLRTSCSVRDPGMLRSKYMQMEEDLSFQTNEEMESQSSPKLMVEALREYWLAIVQVKLEGPRALCEKGPSQVTLRQGPESGLKDKECVVTILKDIGQHITSGSFHNNIVRLGSPINDEVCLFLTSGENDGNSLRCSFGLQLLFQSYKSYLFASQSPSPTLPAASRLQSLQFAQQGTVSIKAALDASNFECRCPRTIAAHLDRLMSDLQSFMRTRVFDLYFQSPWVCGSHILEMLDALFCAGLRLFNYQNYASSILHTYNILRQFNLMSPIPILDKLVEGGLGEIVFPGGRPCRNFRACYARSLGGRLSFDTHHQKAHHRSGCHSITIPAHTGRVTEGIREPKCESDTDHRFDVEKICLLHYIKSRRYHPTRANLDRVCKADGTKPKHTTVPKVLQSVAKGTCSHITHHRDDTLCPDQRLQCFGKAIHAELVGPFPVARVNFFSVYLACRRIVSTISDKYHATLGENKKGQNCVCFVHPLLSAADRCREDENHPFGYKGLVEICQESIENVLLEKDLKDFLWKDL